MCKASSPTYMEHDFGAEMGFRTQPSGHSNLKLMSKVGQYHATTPIELILTSCCCQIANIIQTSIHEVNMRSSTRATGKPPRHIKRQLWSCDHTSQKIGTFTFCLNANQLQTINTDIRADEKMPRHIKLLNTKTLFYYKGKIR